MWFYVDRVWAPTEESHYSDLYPSWYATRELLLHGRDPYGPQVSQEIQVWRYGRAVRPGEQRNENRFAYPLYIGFLLAPVINLPFPQVVRLFRWILPLCALSSTLLWVHMLRWRCNRALLGSLTLLSFGNFPVLESIYLQQPVLLAATFLAGAGACLTAGHLGLAGVLLALATIKPQLTVLLAPWLLLWAVSEWRSRQALIWGFGLTMFLLLLGSQLLVRGWIKEFVAGLVAYQHYTGNFSLLQLLFGRVANVIASLGLVTATAVLGWKLRHEPLTSREFIGFFSLVLVVTVVVMPAIYPTYQVILLPAIFFLLQEWKMMWSRGRIVRLALFASAALVAWPWLGALSLMMASAFKPLAVIRRMWLFPVSSILLVPLSLLIVFATVTPAMVALSRADRRSGVSNAHTSGVV
jgi:hypothetical protein